MNATSDRFAGYLLMKTKESDTLLRELGFDLVEFGRQARRSLPSVVMRTRYLYSTKSPLPAPVMGVWLFEAPWELVEAGTATVKELSVSLSAKLSGFTQRNGSTTHHVFPLNRARASDFSLVARAGRDRRPYSARITAIGLNDDFDYLAVAEPLFSRGRFWRVLVAAIRADGLPATTEWLNRLNPTRLPDQSQSL